MMNKELCTNIATYLLLFVITFTWTRFGTIEVWRYLEQACAAHPLGSEEKCGYTELFEFTFLAGKSTIIPFIFSLLVALGVFILGKNFILSFRD